MIINLSDFLHKDMFLLFGALLLIALVALFSQLSGVINIALEGQLIAGMLGYTTVGFFLRTVFPNQFYLQVFLSVLGALVLISLVTILFSFLVVTIRLDQILVGISFNIVMMGLAAFLILIFKNEPQLTSQSDYISFFQEATVSCASNLQPLCKKSVFFISGNEPQAAFFWPILLVMLSLPIIYLFFYRTTAGLRIRACGENEKVAKLSGFSVKKYRYLAILMGIIFMTGASVMIAERTPAFSGNVWGLGYIGLAMLILGKQKIWLITFFTFIFSFIYQIALNFNNVLFSGKMTEFGREFWRAISFILPIIFLIIYQIWTKKLWIHKIQLWWRTRKENHAK